MHYLYKDTIGFSPFHLLYDYNGNVLRDNNYRINDDPYRRSAMRMVDVQREHQQTSHETVTYRKIRY